MREATAPEIPETVEIKKQAGPAITIESLHTLRISVVRERPPLTERLRLPRDAVTALREFIPTDGREHFLELVVDTRNRVVGIHTISIGGLNSSFVHPREAFCVAVRELAAAVIFGHNHPSGDPSPSQEDRALTTRLVKAGAILGIEVLDHIILGEDSRYFSFKEHGDL